MAVELKVGIGADVEQLNKGINEAKKKIGDFASDVGSLKVPKITIPKVDTESLKIATKEIKSFTEKVKEIGESGQQLQSFGTKISAFVTLPIVGLGVAAVKAFSDLEGVKTAFDRLDDPNLLKNLRTATKGTTSDIELMKAAVQSDKFGLKTSALPTLLEYAGRVAKDTGQSVDYLVNSIVTGIGRKSPLILDNLGISASALKEALGGVAMESASVAQVTEAVGKIARRELDKMGKDTNTLAESWLKVRAAITNSMSKIGEIISKNLNISGVIDKLTGYINSAVEAFENLSPTVQKSILVVVGLVAAAGPLLVVIGSIMAILPSLIAGFGAFSVALTALTGPIGLVVLGIGAIIAAVVGNWDKIKPYILNTINYFRELYNESIVVRIAVAGIAIMFKNAFSAIINILKTAYEIFKSFAKNTATLFSGVGSIIEGGLTFDAGKIKEGVNKIGIAYVGTLADVGKDIKNGVNNLLTDVGTNLMGGLSSVLNDGKLKPITNLNIFDEKAIVKKAETKIDSIADKLKKKVKDKKIEIPELEFGLIGTNKSAGFMNFLGETYQSMLDFENRTREFSQNIGESLNVVPIALSNAQISIQSGILGVMEGLKPLADFGNLLANSLDIAFDSVVNTITDSFSAIGEALASGGSVLSSVGNVVLSGIGSFLGELGKQMIQYGVAALAMSVLSKLLLNPITAAPAAIAMIAAGAALSLASGAIKGTLKGGASSGGTAPTSGGTGSQSYSSSYSSGGSGGGEFVFRISGNDLVTVTDRARDKNLRIGG